MLVVCLRLRLTFFLLFSVSMHTVRANCKAYGNASVRAVPIQRQLPLELRSPMRVPSLSWQRSSVRGLCPRLGGCSLAAYLAAERVRVQAETAKLHAAIRAAAKFQPFAVWQVRGVRGARFWRCRGDFDI